MHTSSSWLLPLSWLVLTGTGCLLCSEEFPEGCMEAFNACEGDPGELLGTSLVELDLRQSLVWTHETAVGNLVADALYATARAHCNSSDRPCPDAAWENAGAIRYETGCGEREVIPAGSLYQRDVEQLLPFTSNKIYVMELTGHDLKLALEHSVDVLGQRMASERGGHFLQVSRLRFEVDCNRVAQAHDPGREVILEPGERIVEGSLQIRSDSGLPGIEPVWEPVITDREHLYRVATNSFIGAGHDGYLAVVARELVAEGERVIAGESAFCDGELLCKSLYNVEGPDGPFSDASSLAWYLRDRVEVAPYVDGRIFLQPSCVTGSR